MGVMLQVGLPREADAGAQARRLLGRSLGPRVAGRLLEDLCLVASELVNNAVVHGRGRIELEVTQVAETIRVRVTDEGSGAMPTMRPPRGEYQAGGRGLQIVDQLASAWGAGTGTVWAELPLAANGVATLVNGTAES